MYEDGKVTKTTPVSVALLYHQMSAIFKDTLNILLIAKVCIHRIMYWKLNQQNPMFMHSATYMLGKSFSVSEQNRFVTKCKHV